MAIDVFISYRGADRALARRLEQRLRSRWGSRVFRDETGLMPGQSWADQLHDAVSDAKVMLALVGPGWYVHAEGEGQDWVRKELLGAVRAGIPVLPVLIGDPKRLTALPEAFQAQALRVSEDLAGFDLQQIEKHLRLLGAFENRQNDGLGEQRSGIVPIVGRDQVSAALDAGESVIVIGASGSGRRALLRDIAEAHAHRSQRADDDDHAQSKGTKAPPSSQKHSTPSFVASCGIDLGARSRRTHGVIAAWIDGLCAAVSELPTLDERVRFGRELVDAVIECGPDLLGREVLRPSWLLPLGDDRSDRQILDAARRPSNRWAPFPPERLVSQSLAVLRRFSERVDRPLILIVDNVEALDGSSVELIRKLTQSPSDQIHMVLASSLRAIESDATSLNIQELIDGSEHGFAHVSLHEPVVWGANGNVIEMWLKRNYVRLDADLSDQFDQTNPYYALSALWYLVDNGYLVEQPQSGTAPRAGTGDGATASSGRSQHPIVTWVQADSGQKLEVPSHDRLLDHMIEEFVPVRFRNVIAAGSLIGRTFPFSAAYAAANPPASVDGQPPSNDEIERWRAAADEMWDELSRIDPDGSVIVCHRSVDRERKIRFAQVDLVIHLASTLDINTARGQHRRLASYFTTPIAKDVGRSLDDQFGRAEAAAHHWAEAREHRHAADAERVAAGLAEQALAYYEARQHYQRAIRLFTQLLAETSRSETVSLIEHQDLLILANCLYRLGQMTRLASERGAVSASTDPTVYFLDALDRLTELSRNLHDKRLAAPSSPGSTATSPRSIPEPNILRHHIRLCEAMRGYVNLELAEWYELRDDASRSRELLFDTLRHAEAARGEAGSRWLLAATSARLAQQLVKDAIRLRHREPVRSHNLAIEARFQIERVLGLEAVSPDEQRDLDEPRSRAWGVLAQIFQNLELEPRLAEWAYRRMNEHRRDVSDLVDMLTDRQLGVFLLSVAPGTDSDGNLSPSALEARQLLERHARWATESGISHECSAAHFNLALQVLVEQAESAEPDLTEAFGYVEQVIARATGADVAQLEQANLLRGVLLGLDNCRLDRSAISADVVVEAFRSAGLDIAPSAESSEVLHAGWRAAMTRWLPVRPQLGYMTRAIAELLGLTDLDDPDSDVVDGLKRADEYVVRLKSSRRCVPSDDESIWKMLTGRVPDECLDHAVLARSNAARLLRVHQAECGITDGLELALIERDIEYAIAVHDWYRSTDPSRLLTLARESNASISGAEWASPNLLRGRLAIQVLDRQFLASKEIGRERFSRISAMVANRAAAASDASPLEQVFYLAGEMAEPDHLTVTRQNDPDAACWPQVALRAGSLSEAYNAAVQERSARVRQAGLPLVQDLHLLDAAAHTVDSENDEGPVPAP